jgi:hypothetical protein
VKRARGISAITGEVRDRSSVYQRSTSESTTKSEVMVVVQEHREIEEIRAFFESKNRAFLITRSGLSEALGRFGNRADHTVVLAGRLSLERRAARLLKPGALGPGAAPTHARKTTYICGRRHDPLSCDVTARKTCIRGLRA